MCASTPSATVKKDNPCKPGIKYTLCGSAPFRASSPVFSTPPVTIWLNGEALAADETLGAPFIAENGQTMVPLRLVGEALRCNVQWQDGVVIVV